MTFNLLVAYIRKLIQDKWTGELRIRFHNGDISARTNRIEDIIK